MKPTSYCSSHAQPYLFCILTTQLQLYLFQNHNHIATVNGKAFAIYLGFIHDVGKTFVLLLSLNNNKNRLPSHIEIIASRVSLSGLLKIRKGFLT